MPVDREKEALEEMARTTVRRPVAWAMIGTFLLCLLAPGVLHLVRSPASLGDAAAGIGRALVAKPTHPIEGAHGTLQAIDAFEGELRNGSPLGAWLRPLAQGVLFDLAGVGNAQVVVGGEGPSGGRVLYFRPSVRHAMGPPFLSASWRRSRRMSAEPWASTPQPDPRVAIRQLADDLAQRGIELVVVPVPVKASVDHAPLGLEAPVVNPSTQKLRAHLARLGVQGPDLQEVLSALPAPRFLATDTHWRPEAVDAAAQAVARDLRKRGVPADRPLRRGRPVDHEGPGDLVDLLDLPPGRVAVDRVQVRPLARRPPREEASVLVLGDSFVGIYEDPTLGFGGDGGFPDALAHHLGQPVDAVVVNAGGAWQARQALVDRVDRLDTIDVVVWLFTERELSFGDWRAVRLPSVDAEVDPTWLVVGAGEERSLRGRVVAVADPADPRTSPYPDQLVALSVQVEGVAPGAPGSRVWGYAWGLEGRQPGVAARLRPGQGVSLVVRSFDASPEAARRAARSEVAERPTGVAPLWIEVAP